MKNNIFSHIKLKKPSPAQMIAGIILILVMAVLIYINAHPPIRHSIIRFFNPDYTPVEYQMSIKDTEATLFKRVNDKVLLLSPEGLIQTDKKLNKSVFANRSGAKPQIDSINNNYIQFFSGSKTVFINQGKSSKEIKCENNVITATINKNGYYAIATEEKGYKAMITVYNKNDNEIFKWHSADNFVVDLSLSPDNKTLGASMIHFGTDKQQNMLTIFKFSEEKPVSSTEIQANFIADIRYTSSGKIFVLTSDSIMMYLLNGEKLWDVSFDGEKLIDYAVNDDYVTVANLSSSALLGRCTVSTYDYGGRKLGEFDNSEDIVALDCEGDTILITNKKSIRTITKKGKETNNIKFAKDVKRGLLYGDTGYAAVVTGNVLHSVKID